MKKRPQPKRRRSAQAQRLQFEHLESRLPLAGNVTVATSGGADLKITGNDLENAITISLDLPNNQWLITGVNDAAGVDTTVNGGASFGVPIPAGGFRNVTIDMKKANTPPADARGLLGADSVEMVDVSMNGTLGIKGKHGGVVELLDVNVVGKTTITFGAGQRAPNLGSLVHLTDSSLGLIQTPGGKGKDVSITTNVSNDEVLITDTFIGGALKLGTGNGNNTVAVLGTRTDPFPGNFDSSTVIDGNVTVTTGAGNDAVGFLGVVVGKNLKIGTGKGNDFSGAADMAVLGTTSVTSTDGDDIAAIGLRDVNGDLLPPNGLGNVLIGNVTVSTGNGNDIVAAHDTTFGGFVNSKLVGGKITITLGSGNDRLAETQNNFTLGALNAIKGSRAGAGFDQLASDLVPVGNSVLKFLQFEQELDLISNFAQIQDVIDDIFVSVNANFADILLDYGVDIGGGGGGGGDLDDSLLEAIALGDVTTANPLAGIIDVGADVDMHSFTVADGQTVDFLLTTTDPTFDGVLRVFDANGNQLAFVDSGFGGDAESTSVTFNVGGTFFVGVSGFGNSAYDAETGNGDGVGSTGTYELSVGGPPDLDDQINEAIDLGNASDDPSINGTLDVGSDVDMYAITVSAGQTVDFILTPGNANLDVVLRIFEADGGQVSIADVNQGGSNEVLQVTFADAGQFFVGVSSFPNDIDYDAITGAGDVDGNESGGYTLAVLNAII